MNLFTRVVFSVITLFAVGTGVKAQAPSITSFSPSNGCVGTSVTITGSNFTGATAVTFGGTNAASFTVNSATSITAVVGNSGTGVIKVSTVLGSCYSIGTYLLASSTNGTYAYLTEHNKVSVLNTATNAITTTINVGSNPGAVCVSPDGTRLYVANTSDYSLSVISTATNSVVATIALGGSPLRIGVSPDGTNAYVTTYNGKVSVINTAANTITATILVGACHDISVSPDGTKAYVTDDVNNTINVINTATNTVSATIPVGSTPRGISISPDGTRAYVTNYNSNTVSVINTTTNTVSATVAVGRNPISISITPDGTKAYVTNYNNGTVSVINTANNSVTATIYMEIGTYTNGISVSPDGTNVYVGTLNRDYITVINTATNNTSDKRISLYHSAMGKFIATVGNSCPPTITSFSPSAMPKDSAITIRGTNFAYASSVSFGGVEAKSFTVVNATTIIAVVNVGSSGNVTVTTPSGTASLAGFSYVPAPIVAAFSPTYGCSGTNVTITGSNFTGAMAVTFGGVNAASFTVNSDTSITALVSNGGNGVVKVTTALGTGSSADNYALVSSFTAYAYVPNFNNNNVSIINTLTNTLLGGVSVGSNPIDLCVSPDAKKVYVSNNGSNYISVINTANNTVSAIVALALSGSIDPRAICASPDGTKVYVATLINGIYVINTATNTVTATIPATVSSMNISPDGTKLYGLNSNNNVLVNINTSTNVVTGIISLGGSTVSSYDGSISFAPDGTKAYIITASKITVINAANYTLMSSIALSGNDLCVSPDGTKVYVSSGDKVGVINAATNTVSISPVLGINLVLGSINISTDGTKLYVVGNSYDNNGLVKPNTGVVYVINTATLTVIATISAGSYHRGSGNFIANIVTDCPLLPLNLLSFTAQQQNSNIALAWQTTNEVNTSHFTIQRSVDGASFSNISKVAAKGDGNYSYANNQLPNGIVVYYRLQMVDKDGSFTYSKVVAVMQVDNRKMLVLFPNPVKDNLFVQITSTKAEKLTLQVTDLQGRILQQEDTQIGVGNVSLSVNTSALAKGSYVLLVKGSGGVQQKQFVKE